MGMEHMAKGFFITGTDTGVGKTRMAVALIHALRARGLRVARRNRLHRRHVQPLRTQRVNQRHSHPRLADAGIGPGDEQPATAHFVPNLWRRSPMANWIT